VRIRGEAVWAGLGVTEWSGIPCDVSVTDVFVKDRHPVLLVAQTRSRLIAQLTVDGEVKERQLSRAASDLEPYTNCPDIL
jgi:hypothetical protein